MSVPGGASGATFAVLKQGATGAVIRRLGYQYSWLSVRNYPSLVRVGRWLNSSTTVGYTMELLSPGTPYLTTPSAVRAATEDVVKALEPVWAEPPLVPGPWAPQDRLDAFPPVLHAWWSTLTVQPHHYCGTHGDPTLENVMRRGDQPVLIDPLPDCVYDGKVPPIRALDLGKILQSGLDYEGVRLGIQPKWMVRPPVFDVVRDACRDQDEWAQACWACALHVAKFLPYQTPELRVRWTTWWPHIIATLQERSAR